MPNTITPFGFVKKAGDIMTGDLNIGLNKLIMNNGVNGGIIRGHPTSPDYIQVRNVANSSYANMLINALDAYHNITMQAGRTIDGVDVSEIGKPCGKLWLSAQQDDIADTTWTLVDLDTIQTGFTDAIENITTHRITPGVAGFYLVIGQAAFTNLVADKKYHVGIYKNGADQIAQAVVQASHAANVFANCSDIEYLDGDDYLELKAYHDAGVGTVDIYAPGDMGTFLSVQRVR